MTYFSQHRCWVSGWGKDAFGPKGKYQSVQKAVDVNVLSASECEKQLRLSRLGRHFTLDSHSFLCAGGDSDKDACTVSFKCQYPHIYCLYNMVCLCG